MEWSRGDIRKLVRVVIEHEIYDMCQREGLDYSVYAFEKAGQIIKFPEKKGEILCDIAEGIVGWLSCVYKREKPKPHVPIEQSEITCFRCKGSNCV